MMNLQARLPRGELHRGNPEGEGTSFHQKLVPHPGHVPQPSENECAYRVRFLVGKAQGEDFVHAPHRGIPPQQDLPSVKLLEIRKPRRLMLVTYVSDDLLDQRHHDDQH
jgi:hypothetical protein